MMKGLLLLMEGGRVEALEMRCLEMRNPCFVDVLVVSNNKEVITYFKKQMQIS